MGIFGDKSLKKKLNNIPNIIYINPNTRIEGSRLVGRYRVIRYTRPCVKIDSASVRVYSSVHLKSRCHVYLVGLYLLPLKT